MRIFDGEGELTESATAATQSASVYKSETVTPSKMSLSQKGTSSGTNEAASVEASAAGILHGASGIGAATLTGIWC